MTAGGLQHVHFEGVPPVRAARDAGSPSFHERALARDVQHAVLDPFVAWLFARYGLDAQAYDPRSLTRRLSACFRQLGVATPAEARARLEADPTRLPRALSAMLVGVSGFFRDGAAFRALEEQVLPRLAPRRSGLRVCALGSSDGQELYSVAMLLAEAGRLDVSELLGLDVRPDAVAFAALGTYTPEQLRDVPPALLARHFVPVAGGAQVRPALRARTRWRTGSVFSPTGDGPWDLILFRNVGIYLTPEAGRRAWEGIAGQLAPHGVVLTGTAERPPADLGLRAVAPCCYGAAA